MRTLLSRKSRILLVRFSGSTTGSASARTQGRIARKSRPPGADAFSRWRIASIFFLIWVVASWPSLLHGQGAAGDDDGQSPDQGLATKHLVVKRPYEPITGTQRLRWAIKSTVGPESLAAGVLSAGIGTARNAPNEYGPSWGGFGRRYGIRLTGISTGNAMEASLGAIWGEDPRYERLEGAPFGARVLNVIRLTFEARYRDGHTGPAFARFMAVSGNNVLSNAWRVSSENQAGDAALRTLMGILGRMGSNAFVEFWPSVRRHIWRPADEDQ